MSKAKRPILDEIKSLHHKAVVALIDVENLMGRMQVEVEKLEGLTPVPAHEITGAEQLIAFRREDLILAGVDVSKWMKPTSSKAT